MSLTSYRAAPPRVEILRAWSRVHRNIFALGRPGSDLLSRVLRHSTIGAEGFHGRVRNGIGCSPFATATGRLSARKKVLVSRPAADVGRCTERRNQADRAISTAKLNASLHLHMRPINVVVYHGSQRDLVSRRVSRLDAFSVYPFTT